jgi:hypothetical protein
MPRFPVAARMPRALLSVVPLAIAVSIAAGCIGVSAKRVPPNGPGTAEVLRCRATRPAVDGMLDDYEDGNNQLTTMGGRDGYWFNAKDDKGSTIDMRFDEPGAGGSEMALHVTGKTVSGDPATGSWGAQVGVKFVNTQGALYYGAKYAGIAFKAKTGPGSARSVRFKIGDANTHPDAGICKTCWNHFGRNLSLTPEWKPYTILFTLVEQEAGWGNPRPAALSTDKLVSMDWTIGPGQTYDLWFDDVTFLECQD